MAAHQAPLSLGFSRQEHWSGLPFPSPGDLPDPRTEPTFPALAGGFFTTKPPGKPSLNYTTIEQDDWRRQWQPTPVLLPGKSHGRSLVGYSPWGLKELVTTSQLNNNVKTSLCLSPVLLFSVSFGKLFLTMSICLNLLLWAEYLLKASFFVAFA